MDNDVSTDLLTMQGRTTEGLVSRILETARAARTTKESWQWAETLKVLALHPGLGQHHASDGSENDNDYFVFDNIDHDEYLALSYTWSHSHYECKPRYTRNVSRANQDNGVVTIRDSVLDRVTKYMKHYGVRHLWIDNECIRQDDPEEKRRALQSMGLVYSRSAYPLAMLFVPIRTNRELNLLGNLLDGDLLVRNKKRKRGSDEYAYTLKEDIVSEGSVYDVLNLLHRLLSDDWWSRAWCFQEEYVAGTEMRLMIPCYETVTEHAYEDLLGSMQTCGELVVQSTKLRLEITRFVLAYLTNGRQKDWILDKGMCRQILEKAGRYTLIHKYGHLLGLETNGRAMSTQILSDLRRKYYTVPSDLLHIAANCNFYSSTLNTVILDRQGSSLSIAILTLFFMNGEIFWSAKPEGSILENGVWFEHSNVFDYLKSVSFNAFLAHEPRYVLSQLRTRRFVRPEITLEGIQTTGHLFSIFETINSEADACDESDSRHAVLENIVGILRSSHRLLARRLDEFLHAQYRYLEDDLYSDYLSVTDAMSFAATSIVSHLQSGGCLAV